MAYVGLPEDAVVYEGLPEGAEIVDIPSDYMEVTPGGGDSVAAEMDKAKSSWTPDMLRGAMRSKGIIDEAKGLVRPTLQGVGAGLGAVIGGTSGLVTGPGAALTTVAGGALGYGMGSQLADILLGDRNTSSLGEEAKQSLSDIGTGAMYEMGGQLGGAAVVPLARGAASLGRFLRHPVKGTSSALENMSLRGAAKQLEAARTPAGPVARQAELNAAETEEVGKRIGGGWKAGLGQATEDPGLLALQRRLNMQTDTGKVLNAEQILQNNQAIRDYINRTIKQGGTVDDVVASLEKIGVQLKDTSIAAARQAENAATGLAGQSKEAVGATLREGADTVKSVLRSKADELYGRVPQDMEIDSTPLYRTIQELGDELDPAFQRPGATPSGIMGRAKGALEPEEVSAPLFDYKTVYNNLSKQTGVSVGKSSKGFYTNSDFQSTLRQYYPSVAGYDKAEIFGALRDGMNGRKLSPFRQSILDDMAHDLEGQGALNFTSQDRALASFLDEPKPMSFKQIKDFRSQVTMAEREARASGDYERAFKLGKLREGVDETLTLAEQTGQGEAVQALRDANKFYREQYVPTVRQGATSRVLAKDKTGAKKVETALVGGEYFKPGQKGIAAAESFGRTFGTDATAKEAIKDYAAQDLLNYARNPLTGEISSSKVAAWIQNHKETLGKLNLGGEFSNVQRASQFADKARAMEAQFSKSRFGKVMDADPDKVVEYLFGGENGRNSIKTMTDLMEATKADPAARQGLKRSFADMLVKKMQTSAQDMAGGSMLSVAKGQNLFKQYEPAMKRLYSKEEMQALKDVQRALEINNRINKAPSGVAGSQTGDSGMTGDMVKKTMELSPKFRMLRVVFQNLKGGYDAQVNDYLARAMYDPMFAKQLQETTRAARTKGIDEATRILRRNIGIAISSGYIAGKKTNSGE